MAAIPLILISGALGSGKTTFVRNIVAANPAVRFGVVVNEFGEVGIDGDLLRPAVPRIVEIRNGCICCTTQDQLVPAVKEVLSRFVIDVLLVEMSGAADPVPAMRSLSVLEPLVAFRRHVALIDASADARMLTRDHGFRNSLATAELAILTKTDITIAAQVEAWREFLAGFVGDACVIEPLRGDVPLAILLDTAREGKRPRRASAFQHRPHRIASLCHRIDCARAAGLQLFAKRYGKQVERFKGILWVDDMLVEVQGVRERVNLTPYRGPPARGRLVFLSRELDEAALRTAVIECLGPADDHVDRADAGHRQPPAA